jgi:outer membrane protein OmpA-like peptidoglycan-associated protein
MELTSGIEVRQPLMASASIRAAALQQEVAEVSTLATAQADRLDATATLTRLAEERVAEVEQRLRQPLLYDVAFSIYGVPFEPGSSTISPEARSLLDQFAERLLLEDVGRYIEVHGHADSPGDAWGAELARERADAIRRYLHLEYGLPLFRISTLASLYAPVEPDVQYGQDPGGAAVLALSQSTPPD